MYTQVFGNYLLSKELITKEQLLAALTKKSLTPIQTSTLALYYGYVSASEAEQLVTMQQEEGRKFSELAIENGYLTQEQVLSLLNSKVPDFLLLGQILLENGAFTYEQFENILVDYRCQNELMELEMNSDKDDVQQLIDIFFILSEKSITSFARLYLELLFNNFIRMIGDDFTPLQPSEITEFSAEYTVMQEIKGTYSSRTYISMDLETAICFTERYTSDAFNEFNEYVQACLEDFLNLHNGLFIVNASNDESTELTLGTPCVVEEEILIFEKGAYYFPVCFPFGMVHFILEVN